MSEFIIQIEKLLTAFQDAEYRFILIEPLIFYGIIIGVVLLITGFFLRAHKLQFAALAIVGLSAFAHAPYKNARLAAAPRMEQVYKISSPARMKSFNANTQAWLQKIWQFRLLVLLAAVTLMVGINRNRLGLGLGIATCLLGIVVAKNAMWLHYQDSIAFHPNLRQHVAPIDTSPKPTSPPAVTQSQWTPEPARTTYVEPAAPATRPLSTSAPQRTAPRRPQSNRIPPPELPVRPKERPVTPLYR